MKCGLYNYLCKNNTKRVKILLIVLILELIYLISLFNTVVFNDQNLYYYTFSTIVQGFLALIAFLGAIVVYKLQIIETDLSKTSDQMKSYLEYFNGIITRTYSWIDSMNEADKIINEEKNYSDVKKQEINSLRVHSQKLHKLSDEKGSIRTRMVDFSLLSFLNISYSLLALPLSRLLVVTDSYILGEILLLIGILVGFISMVYAFRVISTVLGYSFTL